MNLNTGKNITENPGYKKSTQSPGYQKSTLTPTTGGPKFSTRFDSDFRLRLHVPVMLLPLSQTMQKGWSDGLRLITIESKRYQTQCSDKST